MVVFAVMTTGSGGLLVMKRVMCRGKMLGWMEWDLEMVYPWFR